MLGGSKWDIILYMLIGEYTHTLDPKKRLALPAKFRKEIGKEVVITHGLDNCLTVYPIRKWKEVAEKLSSLSMGQSGSRGFNRFILAGAVLSDVDKSGRILIPDFLKDFAQLKSKVVITGIHDRIEIWSDKLWKVYKSKVEKDAEKLAEKLGELGAI